MIRLLLAVLGCKSKIILFRKQGINADLTKKNIFLFPSSFFAICENSVVAGTMYSGRVQIGDQLLLGPDYHGKWVRCIVKSIHCKGLPVESVGSGQSSSFGIRKIGGENKVKLTRKFIRKGKTFNKPTLYLLQCSVEKNRTFIISIFSEMFRPYTERIRLLWQHSDTHSLKIFIYFVFQQEWC
jgi:hypothetical protein